MLHSSELQRDVAGGEASMDSCREDMKPLHISVMLGIETCNILAGMRQTPLVSLFSLARFCRGFLVFIRVFVEQGRNKEKFSFY